MKAFPIEIFNGILKTILGRIMTFEHHKNFSKVLGRAVSIYNSTKSPSLGNLSPNEAIKPDNVSFLQGYFLKNRAESLKPYSKKKPIFYMGQKVRRIRVEKFQRAHKSKYFDKIHTITKVLDLGIPICYNISDFGTKLFYSQELTPVIEEDHENSTLRHDLLGIISSKKVVISRLRSGKPTEFQTQYLVKKSDADPLYMTASEIEEFDNGRQLLDEFEQLKS